MSDMEVPFPFADGKAPDALRTIGEVSDGLKIRQHVLRYWEEQFPMLRPLKRSGGRRYYRPEDVALVMAIDRLVHREGFTLRGARKALAAGAAGGAPMSGGMAPVKSSPPAPASGSVVPELRAIRDRLAAALAAS
jgi:DNA-binding transcriptional MerR regulator